MLIYKRVEKICKLELMRAKVKYYDQKTTRKKELEHFFTYNTKRALNCISETDRFIILNQYLSLNVDPYWYKKYFSRTTYYKLRAKAVKEFNDYL
ncbi:hypothetical protein VBM87_00235 [Mycoplasma sp. 744]|uniref:MG284/MPN403 family protein n=1 Tax=unclassified Mycoplasma TaxID=2683645 RepID=UPI00211BEA60|nr:MULTISPECIES: hypothetical protein [unclassified Mycoplasma]MEA4115216.1 hypothetical protein [Mycoplasma sp. 744]UUM19222.1 hypothetical protein NPA14_02750 [Mycoplasma sp. 1018B]